MSYSLLTFWASWMGIVGKDSVTYRILRLLCRIGTCSSLYVASAKVKMVRFESVTRLTCDPVVCVFPLRTVTHVSENVPRLVDSA